MKDFTIGFIGGGNMARSLIGGLINDGFPAASISVSEPDAAQRSRLAEDFAIETLSDNHQLAQSVDMLVLAVKPQVLRSVAEEIAEEVQAHQPLVVSIAAGIRLADMQRWLGGKAAIVRTMPNTPSLVGSGATGLCANEHVSAQQKERAESVLRAVGIALWVEDEAQIDAVTAVSGSGPAYFFLFMEAMQQAGIDMGLSAENAKMLTLQTALGAAKMAMESPEDCATLRQRVTSPGGTTEQAINSFEQGGLRKLMQDALGAAKARAAELADQLGKD